MKITKKDFYKILEDEKDDVTEFADFLAERQKEFHNENIVVSLEKYRDISLKELLSFLKISNKHRGNRKSFVIVNNSINANEVPEELIVVPSLREAEDLIQMEEIERDLGF
ncbi:MAG TPA: ribonuclease Z [Salinimicrobium sp.]|nr:ribonuclease Z [Salinimicrobium sp.]